MQTQRILVGELQLGQTLNHCIRDGSKSEFDLLLAMLSSDVCEQDQFSLEPNNTKTLLTASLSEQFNVPTPQSLQSTSRLQEEYSLELGNLAKESGLTAARLQHCLRPDALHFKSETIHGLNSDVYDSLSPTIAKRFLNEPQSLNPLTVNVDDLIAAQKNYEAKLVSA